MKGVCNHHDLGPLGAAMWDQALERRLRMLKEMGCNAIRTAHNPPSPDLLEICNSLGFLVINETFDEWRRGWAKEKGIRVAST
jgi:beta-galactosidase